LALILWVPPALLPPPVQWGMFKNVLRLEERGGACKQGPVLQPLLWSRQPTGCDFFLENRIVGSNSFYSTISAFFCSFLFTDSRFSHCFITCFFLAMESIPFVPKCEGTRFGIHALGVMLINPPVGLCRGRYLRFFLQLLVLFENAQTPFYQFFFRHLPPMAVQPNKEFPKMAACETGTLPWQLQMTIRHRSDLGNHCFR